jgi:hypothetical protein
MSRVYKSPDKEDAALSLIGLRGTINSLFRPSGSSPKRTSPKHISSSTRIRVKDVVSLKKNYGTEGKLGNLVGKTANNMFILEIGGKTYNFFRKDLDIADEPKITKPRTSIVHDSEAEQIADHFLTNLDDRIADRVVNIICKKRTSRIKRNSPRKSPTGRRSITRNSPKNQSCKYDEEISIKTGRCIKKCKSDQIRNTITNRCIKSNGRRTSVREIISGSGNDDDLIIEDMPVRRSPIRVLPMQINEGIDTSSDEDEDLIIEEEEPVEYVRRNNSPKHETRLPSILRTREPVEELDDDDLLME